MYNRVVEFNRLGLIYKEKTFLPPDMCNIPTLVIKNSKFSIPEKLFIMEMGKRYDIKLEFRIVGNIGQQDAALVLAI